MITENKPGPSMAGGAEAPAGATFSRMKRLGLAGVLFFTIKGALWIALPLVMARGCVE